jgi:hypothetical protein
LLTVMWGCLGAVGVIGLPWPILYNEERLRKIRRK